MEGKEKVLMSKKAGIGMTKRRRGKVAEEIRRGDFGAVEFLSLTFSPALCSSSFHSNCPPDEGAAFYSAGEIDGGSGGGESEVTGGVKVQGRVAAAVQ